MPDLKPSRILKILELGRTQTLIFFLLSNFESQIDFSASILVENVHVCVFLFQSGEKGGYVHESFSNGLTTLKHKIAFELCKKSHVSVGNIGSGMTSIPPL